MGFMSRHFRTNFFRSDIRLRKASIYSILTIFNSEGEAADETIFRVHEDIRRDFRILFMVLFVVLCFLYPPFPHIVILCTLVFICSYSVFFIRPLICGLFYTYSIGC